MHVESENKRTLRDRHEKKFYLDEDYFDNDEIEDKRTFNLESKLQSNNYDSQFILEMSGEDVNVKYLQENGFKHPILIKDQVGLGIRLPSKNFTVEDVKKCVGSRRMIDVVDVNTQTALEMSMKEWVKYYTTDSNKRARLFNVLSLEFSHTILENYVEQPEIVKQVDWVETVWPRHLREQQTETTNVLEKMYYPKVQKYCLMSVAGCYTDFHIDMGGTSVWYHILHGSKIFWLIPPTEENLKLYENWILSGKQGNEFFADKVDKCQRVLLKPGWTFFIPTGWIHGVYTPEDSLVFGGNYIHSFNISLQLRIWDIENKTHVPMKFRYPYFTEMHWYVLERYLHTLTGKSHRQKSGEELKEEIENLKSEQNNWFLYNSQDPDEEKSDCSKMTTDMYDRPLGVKVHLTRYELEGIRDIIAFLQTLPITKKYVPKDIADPEGLLEDSKIMLIEHQCDDPDFAVTGEFTLRWAPRKKEPKPKMKSYMPTVSCRVQSYSSGGSGRVRAEVAGQKRRRVRCRTCEPCTRDDCQICYFCKDMKKFGGAGVMKQCCLSRRCLAPLLPKTAYCQICKVVKNLNSNKVKVDNDKDLLIMECALCYDIVHPYCLKKSKADLEVEGIENEDLPNSWECPKCVAVGKSNNTTVGEKEGGKRSVIGGRKYSTDSEASSIASYIMKKDQKRKANSQASEEWKSNPVTSDEQEAVEPVDDEVTAAIRPAKFYSNKASADIKEQTSSPEESASSSSKSPSDKSCTSSHHTIHSSSVEKPSLTIILKRSQITSSSSNSKRDSLKKTANSGTRKTLSSNKSSTSEEEQNHNSVISDSSQYEEDGVKESVTQSSPVTVFTTIVSTTASSPGKHYSLRRSKRGRDRSLDSETTSCDSSVEDDQVNHKKVKHEEYSSRKSTSMNSPKVTLIKISPNSCTKLSPVRKSARQVVKPTRFIERDDL